MLLPEEDHTFYKKQGAINVKSIILTAAINPFANLGGLDRGYGDRGGEMRERGGRADREWGKIGTGNCFF